MFHVSLYVFDDTIDTFCICHFFSWSIDNFEKLIHVIAIITSISSSMRTYIYR